ncbi:MAG: ABC transporter ATP-binding protein, partial [Bacteroidetes bacterium]|nr:ABC transporter ATP-binding protein [Bacteroidota bacterium]
TPVKRYSSGMYVRLAFGVAAHLEPEILIVDEVLAVGDAEFQKKALGKMKEVSQGQGRTVLFVSHNMAAMRKLCSKGILLVNGAMANEGTIDTVIDEYTKDGSANNFLQEWDISNAPGNEFIRLLKAKIDFDRSSALKTSSPFAVCFSILCKTAMKFNFSVVLKNSQEDIIFNCISDAKFIEKDKIYEGRLEIPGNLLNDGQYKIDAYFVNTELIKSIFTISDLLTFEIKDERDITVGWIGKWTGVIRPSLNFEINE